VSYSLCCPSRTTFLTGQYSHNHGVTWNFAPFGGYYRFKQLGQKNTLPVWLQHAGYTTGLIGKYLNEYGEKNPREIPPGWDDWQGSVDPSTYQAYGYTINDNGHLVHYGHRARDYQTDVYATRAERFIKENSGKPFFLWVTPNAPHTQTDTGRAEGSPALPPPRYEKTYANVPLRRLPNFDEADVSDKPNIVQAFARLDQTQIDLATAHMRGRLGAVRGVDDMVGRVVAELRRTHQLDNTLIVFTSDNGWLLGEHRVVGQKYFGFEESIRVPLIVRGPGFAKHRTLNDLVMNVDLTPTLVRAAGARAGRSPDGYALQRVAARPGLLRERDMVIETGPNSLGLPYYYGVHTRRYEYEEISTGEGELYDLERDPYELQNVANDPAYASVRAQLSARLQKLKVCRGAACHTRLGSPAP
jgi:arylsulfatase A-like enzyme